MKRPRTKIGFRREVVLLLPGALFVLVVLSVFTLLSYRSAVELLVEDRRGEALRWARRATEVLSATRISTPRALARVAPAARHVVLFDTGGRELLSSRPGPVPEFPGDLELERITEARAWGPNAGGPSVIVSIAPFERRGQRRFVYLVLAAERLAAQQRSVRILTAVVIGVDLAVVALALIFLRRLLGPYDTLLRYIREIAGAPPDDEDEIAFLVSNFESALATLAARTPDDFEDELDTLQRTLVRSMESGVLVLDRHQRLLAINDVGRDLLDVSPASGEIDYREALQGQPEIVSALSAAVDSNQTVQRQEVHLRRQDRERLLGLTVHPLRRDDGVVRGYLGLFADLTDARRQAEEERLSRSLSQLGELTAGIAHELRNSLATLKGYLTLIERRPAEESVTDYLAEIRLESDHLQRVLEDFLSFARPESLRLQAVDLGAVVRTVAADPQCSKAGFRFDDESDGRIRVHADADLLRRAIFNLVLNAVQALESRSQPPPIEIGLSHGPDGQRLSISDRGPGLPAAVRERLFEPFVTARPGGVGMGLALAHRILDLHGAQLRIENRTGGGTRSEIFFPIDTLAT